MNPSCCRTLLLIVVAGMMPLPAVAQTEQTAVSSPRDEAGRPFFSCFDADAYGGDFQSWDFAQDARGVLYVANNDGVLEYDGASWRLIDSQNNITRSLEAARDGRIYVGTFGDFGYLTPDAAGDLQFASLLDEIPEEARTFNDIWTIHDTDDGLYFLARERLFRLTAEGNGWTVKTWEPQQRFLYAFWLEGIYYVHQAGVGLMKMVDDKLVVLPGSEVVANDRMQVMLPYDEVAGETRFLVGTFSNNLYLTDAEGFTPFSTNAQARMSGGALYKGQRLPDGSFVLGLIDGGLYVIDREGNLRQHLDLGAGLGNTIYDVYLSHDDQVWISANNRLCHVEIPSPLSRYDDSMGLGAVVDTKRHNGILYVSTDNNVFYLDPVSRQMVPVSGLGGTKQGWELLESQGDLLAALTSGLYRIEQGQAEIIRESVAGDFHAQILHQSRQHPDVVLVGLLEGIQRFRRMPSGDWVDEGRVEGIDSYIISLVEPEPGVLWIGTYNDGILRVRFGEETFANPTIDRFERDAGLSEHSTVLESRNGPLFAANEQVHRFDEENERFVLDTVLSNLVSFDNSVEEYTFVDDAAGNRWINFGEETTRLRRQPDGTYEVDNAALRRFGTTPAYSIYPEADGVVWFGTTNGVIRYDQGKDKNYEADFPVLIRRVAAGNDSTIYGGAGQVQAVTPRIDASHSALRFSYAALSFVNARENQYQTILSGFDEGWSAWTHENRRDYTNLPPGDYTFRVRAKNIYNHESPEATFALTILPPWYRSWWAYLLYALGVVGVVTGVVRERTRHLKARQRELEQTVTERTAEIQHRVEELDTVNRVSKALVAQLDFDALVRLVGEQMRETFDADIAYVALHDQAAGLIRFPYVYGEALDTIAYGEGLTSQILQTRQPLLLNRDVQGETVRLGIERVGRRSASYLGVPIMAGEVAMGVISVQSTQEENRFGDDDLRLLNTIAANVGVALNNAEAYQQLAAALEELTTTQQQLVQQEKMASLGALTAGIAHEIKNPLNFINNFAEVNEELADEVREDLADFPEALAHIDDLLADLKQNAGVIALHGKRADSIVRSMMAHAREGKGERVQVELNTLIDEHMELAYHGKRAQTPGFNVEIARDYDAAVGEVAVVPQDFGRVILNLVGNAFDAVLEYAAQQNGQYTPQVMVSTRRVGDRVEVRVTDNGPGMNEAVKAKIFEPFFTTKPTGSGTGLGLSLSYDIITQGHGGTLTVESSENEGAVFLLTLPDSPKQVTMP